MIVTSLPMIVFGANANPQTGTRIVSAHERTTGTVDQADGRQTVQVAIPMSVLAGRSLAEGILLHFQLGGGGNNDVNFVATSATNATEASSVASPAVGVSLGALDFDFNFVNQRQLTLNISSTSVSVMPSNVGGEIIVTIPDVRIHHDNPTLNIRLYSAVPPATQVTFSSTILNQVFLTPREAHVNVAIEGGGTRDFEYRLAVQEIRVRENRRGNFIDGTTYVRLEAPVGFTWASGNVTVNPNNPNTWAGWNNSITPLFRWERVDGVTLRVMYLPLNTSGASSAVTLPEVLAITGLVLIAEDNAPMGRVDVNVAVLHELPVDIRPVAERPSTSTSYLASQNLPWLINRPANATAAPHQALRRVATLQIGNRIGAGMQFVRTNDIPTVRTGHLGFQGHGVQTATVELSELLLDSWGSAGVRRVDFQFNQPGVTLVGMYVRAGYNGDRNNRLPATTVRSNLTAGTWGEAADVRLTANGAEVTMTNITSGAAGERLLLRARFYLSIEAGFEAANPGEDIYVTVSGRGLELLPANQRTLAVARPADPVSISAGPVIHVPTNPLGHIVNQEISDIAITIYEPHLLETATNITVRIAGSEPGTQHLGLSLALAGASVSGNGLVLGNPVFSTVQQGIWATNEVSFPILQRPNAGQNSGPITITLQGVRVTGSVHQNVEYSAFLTGNAFEQNYAFATPGHQNVGRFAGRSYSAPVLLYGGGIVADTEGPTGITRPPAASVILHSWDHFEGMAANQPSITQVGIAGRGVSMVAIRAFANVIDATEISSARNAAGVLTATIAAYNTRGEFVVVTIAENSPVAQISVDGVAIPVTDLATWAGPETGVPAGQLAPRNIGGNFFLPGRALANIFGYEVEFVNAHTLRFNP